MTLTVQSKPDHLKSHGSGPASKATVETISGQLKHVTKGHIATQTILF